MYTNDTQQEHSYHEFIQNFSSLSKKIQFDKMAKEDDSIFDVMAGFNTVKFLIEHVDWEKDKDKNKACEFILQECNKMKEARQELQGKAKEVLSGYIKGKDGVKDVSIYGNHASIKLKDNKKEFEISEFLNSDFCQKNGILGFSTLHSDGKSGMHGFVAEEEGRKIRHYVVTDGSYEMTLNWYDTKGEKCTIKINIDADGVKLIEGNGVTQEQLEANKDVKIGGLYLHEALAQGKWKENEVEHEKKDHDRSFETTTRIDVNRDVSVQADVTRGVEPQNAMTSTTNSNNASAKKIPPPVRTTSKDVVNKQDGLGHQDDGQKDEQNNSIPDQGEHQPIAVSSGNDYGFPSSDPSAFTKSLGPDQDDRQRDERYDNPAFTTFRSEKKGDRQSHSGPQSDSKRLSYGSGIEGDFSNEINSQEAKEKRESRQAAREENSGDQVYNLQSFFEENAQNKKTPPPTRTTSKNVVNKQDGLGHQDDRQVDAQENSIPKDQILQDIRNFKKNNLRHTGVVDGSETSIARSSNDSPSPLERSKNEIPYSDIHEHNSDNQGASDAEWKESGQLLSATASNSRSDLGLSSPIRDDRGKSQVNPEQLKKSLEDVGQNGQTPLTEFISKLDEKTQELPLRPVDQKEMSTQTRERLLEDSSTDVKTNDSGYSSPTCDNNKQSQVDPEHLKESLKNVEQSKTLLAEFTSKLDKETQKFPLKPVDQKGISEQTKEHLLVAGLLKDSPVDIKTNDSGFSSPTYTDHSKSQTNFGQLEEKLNEYVRQSDLTPLKELAQRLNQKNYGLKQINPETHYVSPQTKKHLIEAGLLKDNSTDVKTVAKQENNDTNPTVDKNSELYKLLEKDAAQLKAGVIEEEREDTLTEHTDSYDRNRIALANRNRKLPWTEHVTKQQQDKDTKSTSR